jgi:hypothetical protein
MKTVAVPLCVAFLAGIVVGLSLLAVLIMCGVVRYFPNDKGEGGGGSWGVGRHGGASGDSEEGTKAESLEPTSDDGMSESSPGEPGSGDREGGSGAGAGALEAVAPGVSHLA